ncbi:MAG: hypothetical protein BAJATHORv1_10472 [Candidatus Thorarchaeota archaeon]|nr:MAG: hypothetical protein BAJATHORv1_10472 [Candidatus Thorarchaeota archaeon]
MTNLREIIKYLENVAPRDLTVGEHDSRIEIGPQTEQEQLNTTVNRILIATYPSGRVVTRSTQDKANLLITHFPIFRYPSDQISGLDLVRVRLLAKNYISSYVLGSAIVGARDGLTDAVVDALELQKLQEFYTIGKYVDAASLGRICQINENMNHSRFADYVAMKMEQEAVKFTGDLDRKVDSILVCPGHYLGIPELIAANQMNVKTIVTSGVAPETRLVAAEQGLNVIELREFVMEELGMKRLRHRMSLEYPELKIEFTSSEPVSKNLRYR